MAQIVTDGRHQSVRQVARWFDYGHLPPHLQVISQACLTLAADMIRSLPDDPELTAGLRKLLEAKDCFVRCAVTRQDHV
jgi:hypothetical protein